MSKRYQFIDVFRVYCAVLILSMHCLENPVGHNIMNIVVNCFAKQAVPFFFIVTGFFLGAKYMKKRTISVFWEHGILLFKVYMVWIVFCSIEIVHMYIRLYPDAAPIMLIMLIIRRVFFAGYGVYWYLLISAESMIIIGFLIKYQRKKLLMISAVFGFLIGLYYQLGGNSIIHRVFYTVFSWDNNAIMVGIPYMTLGFLLSFYSLTNSRVLISSISTHVIATVCSIVTYLLYKNALIQNNYNVFFPVQALTLFLIGVNLPVQSISKRICIFLRNFSSILFLVHTVVLYNLIDPWLGIDSYMALRVFLPIFVSIIICVIAGKIKNKWVNWVFMLQQ